MKRSVVLSAFMLLPFVAKPQDLQVFDTVIRSDSVAIPEECTVSDVSDNPLYYKLFMPIVLYGSVIDESVYPELNNDNDPDKDLLPLEKYDDSADMTLAKMINETLMSLYLNHPELVEMTEEELMGVPGIIPVYDDMQRGLQLKTQGSAGNTSFDDGVIEHSRYKPRYWKTFGNFQGKYTQSHYSENWYKGGESNHSVLGQLNLEADYARKQTTWDNKLEMKLGYYTTEVDGETVFRTNEDLLRFTSKFGLKAFESWYYSAQFQGYTQFMDVYDTKVPTKLKSKFFAPAYGNLSLGMDYKPKFKNKNVTLSVMISPISYNCRYVSVDSIATNFGIDAGKNFKYTIGSRFDGNLKWKFLDNFTWTSKAQFYTSYESTEINFENTVDYKMYKYFSLQFFCHWRFDDSINRKKDKEGNLMGYGQFKEFFTLNFSYAW